MQLWHALASALLRTPAAHRSCSGQRSYTPPCPTLAKRPNHLTCGNTLLQRAAVAYWFRNDDAAGQYGNAVVMEVNRSPSITYVPGVGFLK